jgi:hypothetical protein
VTARVFEWVSLSRELDAARSLTAPNASRCEALKGAIETARLGDRLLDPPDGVARQPELALEMFQQADHLLDRAGGSRERKDDTGPSQPFQSRYASHANSVELAEAAQRAVDHRIDRTLREVVPLRRLGLLAALRLGLLLVSVLAGIGAASYAAHFWLVGPDLAAGRPFHTSSTLYECDPDARECGGAPTRAFFHTKEEDNPWVEIDLGSIRQVRSVEVGNRSDQAGERALPLLVELSTDGNLYRAVGERSQPFTTWTLEFERQPARFVRLTARRRTILHLEYVRVRR